MLIDETIKIVFLPVAVLVILVGIFGNACTLIAIIKCKHLRSSSVNVLLANIAVSDLMCLLISMPDLVEFYFDRWSLGDVVCRIHGAFLEVSYTVCVFSLTSVAFERYWSMCRPFGVIQTRQKINKVIAGIWLTGNMLSAPLYYGWGVVYEYGSMFCASSQWTTQQYVIYYSIQTIGVYLLPLIFILTTHIKIYRLLREKAYQLPPRQPPSLPTGSVDFPRHSTAETMTLERIKNNQKQRNQNVIKILITVTTSFFLLWTPFIVLRLIKAYVPIPLLMWRISQFLILVMCSVNFFVYSYMSSDFRKVFRSFVARLRNKKEEGNGNNIRLSRIGTKDHSVNIPK